MRLQWTPVQLSLHRRVLCCITTSAVNVKAACTPLPSAADSGPEVAVLCCSSTAWRGETSSVLPVSVSADFLAFSLSLCVVSAAVLAASPSALSA